MTFQAPRGMEDRLPADDWLWRLAEDTAQSVASRFGYQQIRTPVLEPTGLFTRGVGAATDIVDKEMYTFQDRGGDSLTLRPEGTAPVVRAYIQHGMQAWPQPVRLWYLVPAFRYDRPQAGRLRQFHQFGCELFGHEGPEADVELISLAWTYYQELGLRDIGLLINTIGSAEARRQFGAALVTHLEPRRERLSADSRARLERNPLRILDSKDPGDQALLDDGPSLAEFIDPADREHFAAVLEGLDSLGIPYRVEPRLVRGLDYYVRTVFEFQPPDAGSQGTIGGGGRYDPLVSLLGGPAAPAVGFGTGIERILLNLRRAGVAQPDPPPAVFVAWLGPAARPAARQLAAALRGAGIVTVMNLGQRSLKAQLRQAAALPARFAVILGEDEVAAGTAQLRDLTAAVQDVVPLADVAGVLGTRLWNS